MADWLSVLSSDAQAFGLSVTEEQGAKFAAFLDLLLDWNARMNLTAITDPVEAARKHFLDSLTVEAVWQPRPGDAVIDIGTGAGFPGIPLAIRHPDITMVLNDATRKKVDFLQEVIARLPLPNATAVWARAEELGRQPQHRGRYYIALARAVAHLGQLIELAVPLLAVGGRLIAMKGPSCEEELQESRPALQALNAKIHEVARFTLPDAGERCIIVVRKEKKTPDAYPRPMSVMKKRPLFLDKGKGHA